MAQRAHQVRLAAILWRFIERHEKCQARRAGTEEGFDIVTTVPARSADRDAHHPLRTIVSDWVKPLAPRYERLLRPSPGSFPVHEFHAERFRATSPLADRSVLLIEDTWTTGGSTRSAVHSLEEAGAAEVGVVVIGRHVNPEFGDNAQQLQALSKDPFDWGRCTQH